MSNHRRRHLLLGMLLLCNSVSLSDADLRQMWNFSAPALRDPNLDPNGLTINILYPVSDYILPEMVMYNIRDWDCQFDVSEWFVPSLIQPPINFTQGDGAGDGTIEVEVKIDPQSFDNGDLPENATQFWDGFQDKYRVKFCIETGVQTRSDPPVIVDSSETQIMVTYDLTDGFNIELEVTPFLDNITAEEGVGVDAIFCEEGVELNEEQIKALGVRGSELSVCVFPDNETQAKGYYDMDKILSMEWSRDDGGPLVRQAAVVNGAPAGNGLTTLECTPDGCNIRSILKADFFQEEIPTEAPTRAPTEVPSASPTIAPTRWFPPGTTELEVEGYCVDNDGNRYDWYQKNPFGSPLTECYSQASNVQSQLEAAGYPTQVRAIEHDDIGCRILVDGGSGGPALSGYDFFSSSSGASAISPVVDTVEAIGERCIMFSAYSYKNYVAPPVVEGSPLSKGQGTCTNGAGDAMDVLAFYDVDQMMEISTDSCFKLCMDVTGTNGFQGITIIRDEGADVQGNNPAPAYTGIGNFQCLCHLLLNGATDSRIGAAQNFNYPSGKGFYYADTTGTGVNLGGTDGSDPNASCYLYHPQNIEFWENSHCADDAGNLYDYYSPQSGGGSIAQFEGSIVTNCPDTCDSLATALQTFPEYVRGYEIDKSSCRCLVDSGYADRGITGFSLNSAASGTSAVSMILGRDVASEDQTNCYRHVLESYDWGDAYSGSASYMNGGTCADSLGNKIPYVEFWDVNQITHLDINSCQTICDSAFESGGYIAITVIRDASAPATPPYTYDPPGGVFTCRCHLVFEDATDPRITAAQTLQLRSGQGYKDAVGSADDASYSGTVAGSGYAVLDSGSCYAKSPSSSDFQGEGRCVDRGSNAYDYYQKDPVSDCQSECQTLSNDHFVNFPEQMRGMEWDGTNCRCLVDSGYGDRSIPSWTFASASTGTSAISPVIDVDPAAAGWGCYAHRVSAFNSYDPYLGYPVNLGTGYCVDANGDQMDSINIYDVNQIEGYDRDSCHQLCTDVIDNNAAYLGFTIHRDDNTAAGSGAPYTGGGDFHCKCHVHFSGGTDPFIIRAQNAAGNLFGGTPTGAYFTGQGYKDFEDVSLSNGDIASKRYKLNEYCYRWNGRRRDLLQNNIKDGSVTTPDNDGISISSQRTKRMASQALNLLASDNLAKVIAEGHETGKKLRGPTFQDEEDQIEERNLQAVDRPIIIAGSGVALLKLKTSRYKRNLLTGEDGWSTEIRSVERKLQVQGGGPKFDLSLGLEPEDELSYPTSDDAETSSWLWSVVAVAFLGATTSFILVWVAWRKNREEEEKEVLLVKE